MNPTMWALSTLGDGFHHTLLAFKFMSNMILSLAEINEHNKRSTSFLLCEEPLKMCFIILETEILPYKIEVILFSFSEHLHISCFPYFFSSLWSRQDRYLHFHLIEGKMKPREG